MSSETQVPGPASDTGNVLSGTPLGALTAAGFSINYERLPQAIVDFEHAALFFRKRAEDARDLANIRPPGIDGVSINAVAQVGRWASDIGDNNLAAMLEAGARQLEDLAHKLGEDLKTYLQVEELNLPKYPTPGLTI